MEEKKKEEPTSTSPLLDKTIAERELLDKSAIEAKTQADRLEKLKSDELISGTAGGNVPLEKKEETNQEYVDKMRKNGWKADETK